MESGEKMNRGLNIMTTVNWRILYTVIERNYLHDIILVFGCPCHLEEFNEYSNTKDASIKLSDEKNINGSLPYLGALLSQCKKIFTKKKGSYYWSLL